MRVTGPNSPASSHKHCHAIRILRKAWIVNLLNNTEQRITGSPESSALATGLTVSIKSPLHLIVPVLQSQNPYPLNHYI